MIDPIQIIESRSLGADCVLLIMASLSNTQAKELETVAISYGMDVLIEIHDELELERAMLLSSPLFGINNRNLSTFEVSLQVTLDLVSNIPPAVLLVTESGIKTRLHIERMLSHGVYGFLIGEALMTDADPGLALSRLTSF